jgi:hypothetical protein
LQTNLSDTAPYFLDESASFLVRKDSPRRHAHGIASSILLPPNAVINDFV